MKKVCVITGGGSGIGFAAAKEMIKENYHVILVGRNAAKLENDDYTWTLNNFYRQTFSAAMYPIGRRALN